MRSDDICPDCGPDGECPECRSFLERGMEILRSILARKSAEQQRQMRESPVCGRCGHSRAAHFADGPCTAQLMPHNLRDCYCACDGYAPFVPAARAG